MVIQVLHNPILAYARPPPPKKATPALKLAILALSYVIIEWPCVDSVGDYYPMIFKRQASPINLTFFFPKFCMQVHLGRPQQKKGKNRKDIKTQNHCPKIKYNYG